MTVIKTIDASKNPFTLAIGRQLENNYRRIIFDCSGFDTEVETITLVHQRAQDVAPYIVTQTTGETSLAWDITSTDTAFDGIGRAELRINFSNGLAKSAVFRTLVIKSITADTTIPEPLQSWYDAMIAYINDHSVTDEQLAQAVADYIEEHPIEAPVESVNGQTGAVLITAGGLGAYEKPAAGIPETDLAAAVQASLEKAETALQEAPVQSVNNQTGAVVITAASLGALTTETDPAFQASPAADITSQDIASWNGKSDFSGSYNDLTNKPTIPAASSATPADLGTAAAGSSTNYARADHVHKMPTAANIGAYVKPSGGIPKEDLASAVQTSLGKADTALQAAPVTSVNGRTGAVAGLAEAWTVQNMTASDTAATLQENTFYIFPTMTALTVTVGATGMYSFRFTSGTTATTLTVTGATMPDGFATESGKVYEVNIYYGYGVVTAWTA